MLRRHPTPVLTREDLPDLAPHLVDATSVFNPGAIEHDGRTWLMLRVQSRARETFLMLASSENGVDFEVRRETVQIRGLADVPETLYHVYDARLTRIGEDILVMFAADTDGGCRLGIARTRDMQDFELVHIGTDEDTRNGVLFPEKIGGEYVRLERPNAVSLEGGPTSGDQIILATSPDLRQWTHREAVMSGRWRYWDERIGSGPPPVKTREGWLHLYHGVATHFQSVNLYQGGAVLLDLEQPAKVIARTHQNILEPREMYEMVGQVPNVVFPSGMVVDAFDDDGSARPDANVRVYYGAADTVVGLATATVAELIEACRTQ